jgi:hypothetical protein
MENIFRACIGLPPQNDMMLESKAIWFVLKLHFYFKEKKRKRKKRIISN